MFPFDLFKKKPEEDPEEARRESAVLYAQDMMPIWTIEGSFIRKKDGSSILLAAVEGTNDSLYTYDQRLIESEANRDALMAIQHPCTILKIPKAIDSNLQLVHIDEEINKLRRETRAEGRDLPPNHPKRIRLSILEERLRPEAEAEALSGDRITHPTWFAFEIKDKFSDEAGKRDVGIFVNAVRDSGRAAHICSFSEVLEVCQLYFTPKNVDPRAIRGNSPVTAVVRGGKARRS